MGDMNLMTKQKFVKFSDRIYYLQASHETDRPILGVIVGDRHVLMIDGGNSPKHIELFLKELENNRIKKPDFVVLTHWHWDHIFGLSELAIPVIANEKTVQQMLFMKGLKWDDSSLDDRVRKGEEISFCADMIKKEFKSNRDAIQITIPTIIFNKVLTIDLGNVTCRVELVGGDHAPDSSVIFIEEESFLFLGDCNSCDIYAEKRKYTKDKILPLLAKLEDFQAAWYLHSHSEPIDRSIFLQENLECRAIIESISKNGNNLPVIAEDVKAAFRRNLTKEDVEFVHYFINGIEESEL